MYLYPRFRTVDRNQEPTESTLEPMVTNKSIAVIPFANMSNDPEQEYFSDGMMEEILNHLVKIQDLQVISRTSVMQYKGTTKSTSEIARELGVANILEGSVRKAGERVRITVQLIDGGTNMHLWSETYDRKLDDVFAIQSEVAQKVASTLDAQIQPEIIERMEQMPTQNMEAYDLYLKALNNPLLSVEYQVEQEWLNQAIQLDSNFASAYALLGNNIIFQAGFANNKNPIDIADEGKKMLEKALLLDPLDGTSHSRMGAYYMWYEKDFNKAEIEFLTALKLPPTDQIAYRLYLDFLLATGRFDEAIPIGKKLLELNNAPDNSGFMAMVWSYNNEVELYWLKVKPEFEPLHDDPRWQVMLDKVGFLE